MDAQADGKVRHPVMRVYFNRDNTEIFEQIKERVPEGQLSAWAIKAFEQALAKESLTGWLDQYFAEAGKALLLTEEQIGKSSSRGAAQDAELSTDFDGWD